MDPISPAVAAFWKIVDIIIGHRRSKQEKARHEQTIGVLSQIDTKLGRIVEYFDGLPHAAPAVREPFEKGLEHYEKAEYREAIKHFEASFQDEATDSNRAALHLLIGNCFISLSELKEAEGHYRQAEALATQANDQQGLAAAQSGMGLVYRHRGELDLALEHHQKALEIARDIGHRQGEATDLGNIGLVYHRKGELDLALEHHHKALDIHRDIGYRQGEATVLGNMGLVYRRKGELDRALEHHQKALEIDREIGYRHGEANDLGNMGLVYLGKGDPGKAGEYLAQALHIFEEIGAKPSVKSVKRAIQEMEKAKGKRTKP